MPSLIKSNIPKYYKNNIKRQIVFIHDVTSKIKANSYTNLEFKD